MNVSDHELFDSSVINKLKEIIEPVGVELETLKLRYEYALKPSFPDSM